MAFKSGSFLTLAQARRAARAQWHWLAAGAVASGTLGALLLPGAAQTPAITLDDGVPDLPAARPSTATPHVPSAFDTLPVPAAEPRAGATKAASDATFSIEVSHGPVADLIKLIANAGNLDIVVGSDVDDKQQIPYVSLSNVTAERAIRNVALAGNLVWKKLDDKTFFIGKALPAELQQLDVKNLRQISQTYSSGSTVTPGVLPQLNFGNGTSDDNATDNADPFPALTSIRGRRNANANAYAQSNDDEPRETRALRVRNVRPGILAWWIDPSHNQIPIEFATSMSNNAHATDRFTGRPAVDPDLWNRMRGGGSFSQAAPFFNPYGAAATYGNPYANAYSPYMQQMQMMQPQYRSNAQFGFGQQGQQGQQGGRGFGQQGNGNNNGGIGGGGGSLELPEGVDQMIAIDAQNVLLVHATAEGLARLNTIIEYLDRPIRQVEIESQFVNVATTESKGFGIQFGGPDPNATTNNTTTTGTGTGTGTTTDNNNNSSNSTSGLGALPGIAGIQQAIISIGRFRAVIQSLVSNGRARIINSPRVTTMNNLTATLTSVDTQVFALSQTDQGIGGQTSSGQTPLEFDTGISLTVTPTINNDDTITVFLIPVVGQSIPPVGGGGSSTPTSTNGTTNSGTTTTQTSNTVPSFYRTSTQTVQTVANVKDNDVIVLGGLRTRTESVSNTRIPILSRLPIIGKLFRSTARSDNDSELVIFLTARILRRSDDVTPIQGP